MEKMRFLRKIGDGRIWPYTEVLERRNDMYEVDENGNPIGSVDDMPKAAVIETEKEKIESKKPEIKVEQEKAAARKPGRPKKDSDK